MTRLVTVLVLSTLLATSASGSTPPVKPKATSAAFYSQRCGPAWNAVRWYRARYNTHRHVMHQSLAPRLETGMNCKRLRERAAYWRHAANINRIAAKTWSRTLHNHRDWPGAVREVQKAFPGTEAWLLSCSAAESRWGAWVRYGGSPYYAGYEWTNEVGGWLQYRWQTFKGHYRRGLEDLRERGFRFQLPGPDDVRAWLLPLGQAVAGGWAILHGQRSHWFASIGRGC